MTSCNTIITLFPLLLATALLFAGVQAVPPPLSSETINEMIKEETDNGHINDFPHNRVRRAAIDTTKYKYLWVTQCGYFAEKPTDIPALEVAATLAASDQGHIRAAKLIYRMTRFMPLHLYTRLIKDGSVGVFAYNEVIGDFPEFSRTKNTPECGDSCADSCRVTCTSDGRKVDTLVGYGGTRAVIREDNLLCQGTDPYNGNLNVLAHEFAHTITFRALNSTYVDLIKKAFSNVNDKWKPNTYATNNRNEYFAEATTSYFLASLTSERTSGGMNYCGNSHCKAEWASRTNLKAKDAEVFDLVNEIFTNRRVYLEGRIGICNWE